MIRETLWVRVGNDMIEVIVLVLDLKRYLKDVGGSLLSNKE